MNGSRRTLQKLVAFVDDGWDNAEDNHSAFSYGLLNIRRLGRKVICVQNWTGRPDLMDDNGHWRHPFDSARPAVVLRAEWFDPRERLHNRHAQTLWEITLTDE